MLRVRPIFNGLTPVTGQPNLYATCYGSGLYLMGLHLSQVSPISMQHVTGQAYIWLALGKSTKTGDFFLNKENILFLFFYKIKI
jgi:hypothetical protein